MIYRDTVPEGSRLVKTGTILIPLKIRDKVIYVYDYELTVLMIKDWASQGMTRDEIYDFLLETEPPVGQNWY